MTSGKSDKTSSQKLLLLLNETHKLMVRVQPTSTINNTVDITTLTNEYAERPDPLRFTEVMLIICVLLIWCASIFIFIRHSELLRIRHRDLPFRSSIKPPMNLNHITVVHRTSDMVIHSKPRLLSTGGLSSPVYNKHIDEYKNNEMGSPASSNFYTKQGNKRSFDSTNSTTKSPHHDDNFLDPRMISYNVRRSLLDLHRKSMTNLASMRYSLSYSTNDVSTHKAEDEQHLTVDERFVRESPV